LSSSCGFRRLIVEHVFGAVPDTIQGTRSRVIDFVFADHGGVAAHRGARAVHDSPSKVVRSAVNAELLKRMTAAAQSINLFRILLPIFSGLFNVGVTE
jgi:hypothetical protein